MADVKIYNGCSSYNDGDGCTWMLKEAEEWSLINHTAHNVARILDGLAKISHLLVGSVQAILAGRGWLALFY